jgi:two-component system, response regulator, stage 0 sporulation protein F
MAEFKTVPSPSRARNESNASCGRILLAEDAEEMRAVLALRLRQQGYSVTECRNGAELLSELKDYLEGIPGDKAQPHYDLIISDIRMPGVFGTSVVDGAAESRDFPPTILITAFGDEETHARAGRGNVAAVLDKPFDVDVLLGAVRDALSRPATA